MNDDDEPAAARMQEELEAVIAAYRAANLLTFGEAIGILECIKYDLLRELTSDGEETEYGG